MAQSIMLGFLGKLISDRIRSKSKRRHSPYELAVFAVHGAFSGFWFGNWFPQLEKITRRLLGPTNGEGPVSVAVKTGVHCLLQNPVFLLITLLYLKLALPRPYWEEPAVRQRRRQGRGEGEGVVTEELSRRLAAVAQAFPSALHANVRLWVPATLINLSVVPPHLRSLFGAVVALAWNVQLAIRSS